MPKGAKTMLDDICRTFFFLVENISEGEGYRGHLWMMISSEKQTTRANVQLRQISI